MVKTTYIIDDQDHKEIKDLAKRSSRSDVSIVRDIIKDFLRRPRTDQLQALGIASLKRRNHTG